MSYILDALKRADAERQRGAVPGLHAQPVGQAVAYPGPVSQSRWWWLVGLAGVSVAAVLAHWMLAKPPAVTAPMAAPVTAPAPALASATVQAEPAPLAPPLPAVNVQAPHVVQAVSEPKPERPAPPAAVPPPNKAKATVMASAAPKPVTPASKPTSVTVDVPKLSELPDDVRKQIPALAINGSVYADTPANRMLVINGQVHTQGSQIAPDIRLEEIGAKSAVFSLGATRFRLSY